MEYKITDRLDMETLDDIAYELSQEMNALNDTIQSLNTQYNFLAKKMRHIEEMQESLYRLHELETEEE